MIESNIYLEMILHTNLDLTGGVQNIPPKKAEEHRSGGTRTPWNPIFQQKRGTSSPHLYKTTTFRGRLPCHSLSPGPDQPVTKNLCRCSIPCNVHRYAAGRRHRASDSPSIIYPKTGKTKPKTKERTLS